MGCGSDKKLNSRNISQRTEQKCVKLLILSVISAFKPLKKIKINAENVVKETIRNAEQHIILLVRYTSPLLYTRVAYLRALPMR